MPSRCESCDGDLEPASGWPLCDPCLAALGVSRLARDLEGDLPDDPPADPPPEPPAPAPEG